MYFTLDAQRDAQDLLGILDIFSLSNSTENSQNQGVT